MIYINLTPSKCEYGVRTASIVLLLDFFFTTKRLCTVNQSKMEDIHSSLFGIVGLWMSAPSWSMTHTLLDPRAKMSDLRLSVPCSDVKKQSPYALVLSSSLNCEYRCFM
jgi:hypothetical protein